MGYHLSLVNALQWKGVTVMSRLVGNTHFINHVPLCVMRMWCLCVWCVCVWCVCVCVCVCEGGGRGVNAVVTLGF